MGGGQGRACGPGSFWKPGFQPLWSLTCLHLAQDRRKPAPKALHAHWPCPRVELCWGSCRRGRARACAQPPAHTLMSLAVMLAPKARSGGVPAPHVPTGHIPVPGRWTLGWLGAASALTSLRSALESWGITKPPGLRLALKDRTAQPLFLYPVRPHKGSGWASTPSPQPVRRGGTLRGPGVPAMAQTTLPLKAKDKNDSNGGDTGHTPATLALGIGHGRSRARSQ